MSKKQNIRKLYIYATVMDNRYLLEYRELDENGKITTEIAFTPDGVVYEKVIHTYIGDYVLQSNYFSGNDEASHTVSFDYDDDGKVIKESTWYADGSLSIKTFERDETLNDETIVTRDEDGSIEGKEYYRYDKNHLPLQEIKYDEKGEQIEEEVAYTYDEHGFIESIHSQVEGEEDFKRTFEYIKDDHNNIVETKIYNEAGEIMGTDSREYTFDRKVSALEENNYYTSQYKKTTWQYDDNGNNSVIRQFNAKGEMIVEILLTYNENNLIVVEETRSSTSGVTLKEYVYEFYEVGEEIKS